MYLFDVCDIEELVGERCQDRYMDPSDYLKRESEIRQDVLENMDKFKRIQEERAERFKSLYKALDEFNAYKMYDEMKKMRKKKHILTYLYNETAKFRAVYKRGDRNWIKHLNYKDEFFDDCFKEGRGFECYSQEEILRVFRSIFNLERDSSSDSY